MKTLLVFLIVVWTILLMSSCAFMHPPRKVLIQHARRLCECDGGLRNVGFDDAFAMLKATCSNGAEAEIAYENYVERCR